MPFQAQEFNPSDSGWEYTLTFSHGVSEDINWRTMFTATVRPAMRNEGDPDTTSSAVEQFLVAVSEIPGFRVEDVSGTYRTKAHVEPWVAPEPE